LSIVATSEKIHDLVEDQPLEELANGFGFLEGLTYSAQGDFLHFVDLTNSRRCRWVASSGAVEVLADPSNMANGMTLDKDGDLLICEHVTSSLVRLSADGERTVLASHYDGHELNSPNEVVTGPDGSIYFTDPPYGRMAGFGIEREQDLSFQGVYRIPPGGELELLVDDFKGPNGMCFSPDNKLLYINDSERALIRVWDVAADGSISNGRLFVDAIGKGDPAEGIPDGMKCDELGNVLVTGPGGIWIFAADGEKLGVIEAPEGVGNFCFGGTDYRTLFIGASSTLYRLPMKVASHREPYLA
jgi:gluconolactonase